jgi:hypothetical protein
MYLDYVAGPRYVKETPYVLDVTRQFTFVVNAVFSTRPGIVRGVVTSGKTPVIGAPVILRALGEEVQAKLRSAPYTATGPDGRFEFKLVPPGQYEVLSSFELAPPEDGEWEYPSGKSVLVEAGKTADVEIGLTRIAGVQ